MAASETGGFVRVGDPSTGSLDALLAEVSRAEVTYRHVGSTLDPASPGGGHVHAASLRLGAGPDAFAAAVGGLRAWACHRGIGAAVHPADTPIAAGASLLVILPAGPVRIVVPNRIVAVLDEPDRFGFAYGSLPGHQERGEESFVVDRRADGSVWATVRVDAVPATVAARLVAPGVRWFQHLAVRRYLGALAATVEDTP